MLTWAQLGLHAKPCGLLNVAGYFDPLLQLFDHAVQERFLRPEHGALVSTAKSPAVLLDQISDYEPAVVEEWIDRDES